MIQTEYFTSSEMNEQKHSGYIDFMIDEHLTRENLISCCRYYKGEDTNPYDEKEPDKSIFWFYEQCWVKFMFDDDGKYICNMSQEYEKYGLTDFEKSDGTPESLKALLFNRYSHWVMGDTDSFKRWYIEYYRAE